MRTEEILIFILNNYFDFWKKVSQLSDLNVVLDVSRKQVKSKAYRDNEKKAQNSGQIPDYPKAQL